MAKLSFEDAVLTKLDTIIRLIGEKKSPIPTHQNGSLILFKKDKDGNRLFDGNREFSNCSAVSVYSYAEQFHPNEISDFFMLINGVEFKLLAFKDQACS